MIYFDLAPRPSMMNSVVFVCFLLLVPSFCAKLPQNFPKCNKKNDDFKECMAKALERALQILDKPAKEINLPSLDPLEIPALTIGAGTGAVGLQQNYKNVRFFGFTKPTPGTSEFDVDFEKKTATLAIVFPELKMNTDYDVNGKILLLPVYGEGPSTVILENVRADVTLNCEEYEKKGKKYWKVAEGKLILTPKLTKFNFENLFNGDKALGDNINKVLNENWQEVFSDVKLNYEEAFGQIIVSLFNNVFAKVPVSDLFE